MNPGAAEGTSQKKIAIDMGSTDKSGLGLATHPSNFFFSRGLPSFDAKLASQEPTLEALTDTTGQIMERHAPFRSISVLWLEPSPFGRRQEGVVQLHMKTDEWNVRGRRSSLISYVLAQVSHDTNLYQKSSKPDGAEAVQSIIHPFPHPVFSIHKVRHPNQR